MGWWLFALLLDVHSAASAVDPVRIDRAGQSYQDASIGTLEAGECADSDSLFPRSSREGEGESDAASAGGERARRLCGVLFTPL